MHTKNANRPGMNGHKKARKGTKRLEGFDHGYFPEGNKEMKKGILWLVVRFAMSAVLWLAPFSASYLGGSWSNCWQVAENELSKVGDFVKTGETLKTQPGTGCSPAWLLRAPQAWSSYA